MMLERVEQKAGETRDDACKQQILQKYFKQYSALNYTDLTDKSGLIITPVQKLKPDSFAIL